MNEMPAPASLANSRLTVQDFVSTGSGTPAGKYLRTFWHPVYHCADLKKEHPVALRIMSESFTLYRGASGQVHLIDHRCPHRGAQLSAGWVQGDEIRCFYHGWKFAGDGSCTEQPAEDNSFCHRVKLRSFATREHLGLIFAYLGEGEPPAFPVYPEFENFEGFVELDTYLRECNYFQNIENSLDMSHVGFVHGDNSAIFNGIGHGKRLTAKESDWGVAYTFTREDGQTRTHQFGMPNRFYMTALPTDPEIGWQETMGWFVPIDDERHLQFVVRRIRADGAASERIIKRRLRRRENMVLAHQQVCEEVLTGRMRLSDLDPDQINLVNVQDDIAQVGQGRIADRSIEHLGRGDTGLIAIRRLWLREVAALLDSRPLKHWERTSAIVPNAWALPGQERLVGAAGTRLATEHKAPIVDLRAEAEIDLQLRALHGAPRRQ